MPLTPGTRLGPYEILSLIGAGGMGEVYRAQDSRLKRAVAVKILPEAIAGDPERVSRFEREAELLASLNHTNIAIVHDFEVGASRRFLVMELVEGETLAERLKRGRLPIDEAHDSNSSTLLSGTAGGIILGTAAYMSPEQARGKPVDQRVDIWALGCVTYEMLSGKQAFAGDTPSRA